MSGAKFPCSAVLVLDGWAGRLEQPVEVIGETPKRYRIRAIERTRIPGYCRYLKPGDVKLVPKFAVDLGATPPTEGRA